MDAFSRIYAKHLRMKGEYDTLFQYCSSFPEDAAAIDMLSICYHNGYGTTKDYNKSFSLSTESAKRGDADGIAGLAYDYLYGHGTDVDVEKAIVLLKQAIGLGSKDAMRYLGACYEKGTGVKKDERKAAELYQKAAKLGSSGAMCDLGVCYEDGIGIEKDEHKAVEWYQKAAELGNSRAMRFLGINYENGIGIEKDEQKAVEWYQKAADLGDSRAICCLGVCYEYGTGVEKNECEAAELYRQAADLGNSRAMCSLGVCFEHGTGVEKDEHKAVEWYQKAAELGDTDAMCDLGVCYEYGIGVEKDECKAAELYQKAADLGDSRAIYCLGVCYEDGIGVEKDEIKAMEWYRKAADLGISNAVFGLARCCKENGFSKADAEYVIEQLSKLENSDSYDGEALFLIANIYKNGPDSIRNAEKAFQYFEKAHFSGWLPASRELAYCYEYGKGVQKNEAMAFSVLSSSIYGQEPSELVQLYEILLGVYYEYGIGTIKDEKKAVEIYEKYLYAEDDLISGIAKFMLGLCHYYGSGVPCNIDKATELFHASSYELATFYTRAISDNDPSAYYGISLMYSITGHCLFRTDHHRAFQAAQKAYEYNPNSKEYITRLAGMYFYGKGVSKNLGEAYRLYEQANTIEARQIIGEYYFYGCGIKQDYVKAINIFFDGARKGLSRAKVYLGLCYLHGYAVDCNLNLALQQFEEAVQSEDWYGDHGCGLAAILIFRYPSLFQERQSEAFSMLKHLGNSKNAFWNYFSTIYILALKYVPKEYTRLMLNLAEFRLANAYIERNFRKKLWLCLQMLPLNLKIAIQDCCSKSKGNNKQELRQIVLSLRQELSHAQETIQYQEELLDSRSKAIEHLSGEIDFYRRQMKESLDSISNELTSGFEKLFSLLQNQIYEEKKQTSNSILNCPTEEAREDQYMSFINRMADTICTRIFRGDTKDVDIEEAVLKGMFGESWNMLHSYTRKSLISARVFLHSCSKMSYGGLDFSGVVIACTSALENELKLRFLDGFQRYLQNKYGSDLTLWPKSMKYYDKNEHTYKVEKKFTLGSMPSIFGGRVRVASHNPATIKREYKIDLSSSDQKELDDYIKTIAISDADGLHSFFKENDEKLSFLDRCEDIRFVYRNSAAHTETMSRESAEACCQDVMGVSEIDAAQGIGHIQGLLYELVKMTRLPR